MSLSGLVARRLSIVTAAGLVLAGTAAPGVAYERPYAAQRVDLSNGGEPATRRLGHVWGGSTSISADGRYLAFDHIAENLHPGGANQMTDVF
ncbi:MAG: hypothetical protein ACRDLB_14725, partial [Actinomycetota bacterium]